MLVAAAFLLMNELPRLRVFEDRGSCYTRVVVVVTVKFSGCLPLREYDAFLSPLHLQVGTRDAGTSMPMFATQSLTRVDKTLLFHGFHCQGTPSTCLQGQMCHEELLFDV